METPLHPQKCMVWCTILSVAIVGPVFLDCTVNAQCYLKLLQGQVCFVSDLQGMEVNMEETISNKMGQNHMQQMQFFIL
jgi:hypothetical protein